MSKFVATGPNMSITGSQSIEVIHKWTPHGEKKMLGVTKFTETDWYYSHAQFLIRIEHDNNPLYSI